jgi:hypothetical protein
MGFHNKEHDMWEDRFAQEGYLFGTEPVPFLLKHDALFQAGQSVLSIAEGEGRNGVHLAKKGLDVTGVEFAPSAVTKAKKLETLNGVDSTFIQSDLFDWDWPQDAFDITLGLFFQFVGPVERDILWRKMLGATRAGRVDRDPRLYAETARAWHGWSSQCGEYVYKRQL